MGRLISLIGMDGAGKTTLTQALERHLKKLGYKSEIVYAGRGRNNVLPIQFFGTIYRKAGGTESNAPERGELFEKISIFHTLAAPIFALDMLLRYFFVIRPKLNKNDVVITDRYSIDVLLMNKVPEGLKRFLYSFFPKPNKLFYVYNTIAVLHKRKPEHPIEDLRRQEKIFSKILKTVHATKIKNDRISQSLNKIVKEVLKDGH